MSAFVMMACDQMDAVSSEMPTQEMIEMMADNIYDDICRMYPDMVEYIRSAEQKGGANIPAQGFITLIGTGTEAVSGGEGIQRLH